MASLRVVIAGGGRVGARTARLLDNRGHDIVVIENDPDAAAALSDEYVATIIEGDATQPSILSQADLDRADVVAALTEDTETNLAICLTTDRLTPDVATVMRTEREVGTEYDEFTDDVVFTEAAGARAAANAIERDVRTLEDVTGSLDIVELTTASGAPVAGKSLADVALPRGSLVVSDADGNRIAGSETMLEAGETYLVAVEPEVSDEILNLFRGTGG
ncbi:MAG: NAD-binding protein [Haloferacaceae archaeon]